MTTAGLLEDSGIRTAIIVDDAYDPTPTAHDLITAEDEWLNFFDDLNDADLTTIVEFFPEFESMTQAALTRDDAFVATLFNERSTLRPELTDALFEPYNQDLHDDLVFLQVVKDRLQEFGLEVSEAGRDFVQAAELVHLIVIDLFLGAAQTDSDMEVSIEGLKAIIEARNPVPPIIVLMSRSSRLVANSDQFRDRTRVFASGFRTIKKLNLHAPGRLEQLLMELARHREDSLRLTRFVKEWKTGLSVALKETASDIRRLDLEDWAQIRDLLLVESEVSTGNYILDVFDRVLLHEMERHEGTIDAACGLNILQSETYPPNTISASKDTLALVLKTLYQHPNRRGLDADNASLVSFGDILGLVDQTNPPPGSVFEGENNTVFLVMSPACDLQRRKAPRVLLMAGKCKPLDASAVNPVSAAPRTTVLELAPERRVCVDWQPHHVAALTYDNFSTLLSDGGGVRVVGRLRNANAVSLQQRLLSNLGRVGLVAPIPSTFPVDIRVFYPSQDSELTLLPMEEHETISGVCFVGRDGGQKTARAPFDTSARFSLLDALNGLADELVHNNSVGKIRQSRNLEVVDFLFSRGVRLNVSNTKPQGWKAPVNNVEQTLGKIVYNQTVSDSFTTPGEKRGAGLVFEINECSDPAT